jgi:ribosomal protein S18 acetylase RimI-like enzyme
MADSSSYRIRSASPKDALRITLLYHRVYHGTYTDPLMRDVGLLTAFLSKPANVWVVAERKGEIVGSVAWETDERNRLAKVFGGAVLPEHRGAKILERSMRFGARRLQAGAGKADVIYATTRTTTTAPQIIAEKLGYKKLGIFPNVHRTDAYETHCLTALFRKGALSRRFTDFKLHPKFAGLVDIVMSETGIPAIPLAEPSEYSVTLETPADIPALELIDAPLFTQARFKSLGEDKKIPFHFYPFHQPNVTIASPCRKVEIFAFLAPADQYCTLVGIRKPDDILFARVLQKASDLLHRRGVRYIETIARADKLKTVEGILQAGFIPCAYFPAFQLHDRRRYDYVVLSKTFEILDFRNTNLAGTNRKFLREYFRNWRDIFLGPHLMD